MGILIKAAENLIEAGRAAAKNDFVKRAFKEMPFTKNDTILVPMRLFLADPEFNLFTLGDRECSREVSTKLFVKAGVFFSKLLISDREARIYARVFGTLVNTPDGSKAACADAIWLDTSLERAKIREALRESRLPAPSEITRVPYNPNPLRYLLLLDEGADGRPKVTPLRTREQVERFTELFWG